MIVLGDALWTPFFNRLHGLWDACFEMQIKRVQYYSWQEADNAHKASVGRSRLMELTNAEVWPKCTLAKKARQAHPASLTWPQLQPAPRRLDDCRVRRVCSGATRCSVRTGLRCSNVPSANCSVPSAPPYCTSRAIHLFSPLRTKSCSSHILYITHFSERHLNGFMIM